MFVILFRLVGLAQDANQISWSSDATPCTVEDINISKEPAAFIFRIWVIKILTTMNNKVTVFHSEDGGSRFLRIVVTCLWVTYLIQEDHNLNVHLCENPRSRRSGVPSRFPAMCLVSRIACIASDVLLRPGHIEFVHPFILRPSMNENGKQKAFVYFVSHTFVC
jgi:hypothetical protein